MLVVKTGGRLFDVGWFAHCRRLAATVGRLRRRRRRRRRLSITVTHQLAKNVLTHRLDVLVTQTTRSCQSATCAICRRLDELRLEFSHHRLDQVSNEYLQL